MATVRIDSGELPSAKGKTGPELESVLRRWQSIADGRFEYDCKALLQMIDEVDALRLWEYAREGFYKTRDEFLEKVVLIDFDLTEHSLTQIVTRLRGLEKVGIPRIDQAAKARTDAAQAEKNQKLGVNLVDNINKVERATGTSSTYLLRRLARRAPEVLSRWERGEFKSVRAAAIEAGIVTPKTPLDELRAWWKKASAEDRDLFLSEIQGNT